MFTFTPLLTREAIIARICERCIR